MRKWESCHSTLRRLASLAVLSAGMSACVPLAPYEKAPGYYGSRTDLGDGVPAFIVTGTTSRAEVTRTLGTPEVEAPDSQWSYYESNYLKTESGAWAFTYFPGTFVERWPQHNQLLLRRLLLRYDAAGLVTDVEFNSAQCEDIFVRSLVDARAADLESCPILRQDKSMRAERQSARMRQAFATEPDPVHWFEYALWRTGKRSLVFGSGLECSAAQVHWSSGLLGVSARYVVFLPRESISNGHAVEPLRIARKQFSRVQSIDNLYEKNVGIEITLADGNEVSLSLCMQTSGWDTPRIEAVLKLLAVPSQAAL